MATQTLPLLDGRQARPDRGSVSALTSSQLRTLDAALALIRAEVIRAVNKHGARAFASPHEGYGVLLEEVDEVWDEIKANNLSASVDEVIQVGAMAAHYVVSFALPERFDVRDHALVPVLPARPLIQRGAA